jgi:hypothetical protein
MMLRRALVTTVAVAMLATGQTSVARSAGIGTGEAPVPVDHPADLIVDQQPRPPRIGQAHEVGKLSQPPSVTARDVGASALIGSRVLWTFGDTLLKAPAEDGERMRSSTAALGRVASPLKLEEPLDSKGAPKQFLPFTDEEEQYNHDSGRPDERIAVWPGSVVADGKGGGIVYYSKLFVHPGELNYEQIGVGLARVGPGETVAKRDPGLVFKAPEPAFDSGALVVDSDVLVYGCTPDGSLDFPCLVARAPLARAGDRAAYRFWDGSDWTSDLGAAKPVLRGPSSGLAVTRSEHLGTYLAIYSEIFSNRVLLRTAARPEGPWSEPVEAYKSPAPPQGTNYAAREHPELARDGGRTIVISYYHPTGALTGEMRLVELTFE